MFVLFSAIIFFLASLLTINLFSLFGCFAFDIIPKEYNKNRDKWAAYSNEKFRALRKNIHVNGIINVPRPPQKTKLCRYTWLQLTVIKIIYDRITTIISSQHFCRISVHKCEWIINFNITIYISCAQMWSIYKCIT